jgi:Ribonuclease G/E
MKLLLFPLICFACLIVVSCYETNVGYKKIQRFSAITLVEINQPEKNRNYYELIWQDDMKCRHTTIIKDTTGMQLVVGKTTRSTLIDQ